jgi:ABC-type multidrug transport system fused ATPase/permease subunit
MTKHYLFLLIILSFNISTVIKPIKDNLSNSNISLSYYKIPKQHLNNIKIFLQIIFKKNYIFFLAYGLKLCFSSLVLFLIKDILDRIKDLNNNQLQKDDFKKQAIKLITVTGIFYVIDYLLHEYLKKTRNKIELKIKNTFLKYLMDETYEQSVGINTNQLNMNINDLSIEIIDILNQFFDIIINSIFSIGLIVYIFTINYVIALIFLTIGVFNIIYTIFILKLTRPIIKNSIHNKEIMENNQKTLINNLMITKIFSLENLMLKDNIKFQNNYNNNRIIQNNYNKTLLIFFYLTQFIFLIIFSIYSYSTNDFQSFFTILISLGQLAKYLQQSFFLGYHIPRQLNLLHKKITGFNFQKSKKKTFKNLKFTGNFKIINGKKNLKNNIILNDINFQLNEDFKSQFNINKKGLKIGLVGPSGSGKSTLLKSLNNLYNLDNDSLFFEVIEDSQNKFYSIKDLHPKDLSNNIGFLPQENYIFLTTLKNNITLFEDIPMDIIEKAIEASQLKPLIINKGLDYNLLENGKNLSGGQIRRVNIARTIANSLYKSIHPILLLDEPETGLDKNNCNLLMDKLFNIYQDSILIVCTHNFDIMKKMDVLIYMEDGKIVKIEKNHQQLTSN